MGASNFNQLLNGVWGPGGDRKPCITLLAGAKLDVVVGRRDGQLLSQPEVLEGEVVSAQLIATLIHGGTAQASIVTTVTTLGDPSPDGLLLVGSRFASRCENGSI